MNCLTCNSYVNAVCTAVACSKRISTQTKVEGGSEYVFPVTNGDAFVFAEVVNG